MTYDELRVIALELANTIGSINISRQMLCDRAGIPSGSFHYIAGKTFTEFMAEMPMVPAGGAVTRKRIDPTARKEMILLAAVNLSKEIGYLNVRRDQIADEAGISGGLVTKYFTTMPQLRRAIMRYAVLHEVLEVVAQGIAAKDAQALKAPEELKYRAVASMV